MGRNTADSTAEFLYPGIEPEELAATAVDDARDGPSPGEPDGASACS